jgi:nicotinate phosphoribosyltransferase
MSPVIQSLLDTDLYKFTMWQAMLHRHPATHTVYKFVSRTESQYPLAELADEIQSELDQLCTLRLQRSELDFLGSLRFMKADFVDFLRIFHFQRDFIRVWVEAGELSIEAAGPQVHVMGFEVFVLAIVNELFFRRLAASSAEVEARRRLKGKIGRLEALEQQPDLSHPFEFFDFGTRRRFSRDWHREVVETLSSRVPKSFKGTSNVLLARDLNLVPIGTMGHEFLQTYQGLGVRLRAFQQAALEDWVQEYRGDLGIALTDTVGMDAFLSDFDLYFAKLFEGLRHDSGDPIEWGEKALAHYQRLRIDSHNKRLVFSDALDLEKAIDLYRYFGRRVQTGFGIGTNLTNDVGLTPLNIVMKLTNVNGQPVAKLSDSPGKTICSDATFLAYLRQVFHVR